MQTSTTDQFQVEHIEYVSEHPFDDVVAALEKATGDVTDGKFETEVASAKDKEDFEKRARSFEADSGFMRFLSLDHGGFLTLMGFPAKVRQYTIGNPLIAATMLLHDIGAALNVPVRLVIYEGTDGRTRLGYDRPSSLMQRLGNPELSAAARPEAGRQACGTRRARHRHMNASAESDTPDLDLRLTRSHRA